MIDPPPETLLDVFLAGLSIRAECMSCRRWKNFCAGRLMFVQLRAGRSIALAELGDLAARMWCQDCYRHNARLFVTDGPSSGPNDRSQGGLKRLRGMR